MRTFIALFLLGLFAESALASITVGNLEWELSPSHDSYNNVELALAQANTGWRHATKTEVDDLFNNNPGWQNFIFFKPDGTQGYLFAPDSLDPSGSVAGGFYESPGSPFGIAIRGVAFRIRTSPTNPPFFVADSVYEFNNFDRDYDQEVTFHHWLVRPVPEPSSMLIWGLIAVTTAGYLHSHRLKTLVFRSATR